MQFFRKRRNKPAVKAVIGRVLPRQKPGFPRLFAQTAHWLAKLQAGGHLNHGLRGIIKAYAPSAPTPKDMSFKLKSIRRLWGSTLSIGLRVKW
jgi:hypothetical protein